MSDGTQDRPLAQRPHLPQPLAPATLVALAASVTTLEDAQALQAQVRTAREHVSAAIDTITLAIQHNHANFLASRGCWSYETRIEADTILKTLRRQRQHLQECYGRVNRQVRDLEVAARQALRPHGQSAAGDGLAEHFMQVARHLLDATTYAMLLEAAREVGQPS
jgi:hypothetical protein